MYVDVDVDIGNDVKVDGVGISVIKSTRLHRADSKLVLVLAFAPWPSYPPHLASL
jgi:hypothetical protein